MGHAGNHIRTGSRAGKQTLFSPFLDEAKALKLRRTAIDNLPRFRSESG